MDNCAARLTRNLEKEQEFANEILFEGQNLRLGVVSMSKKWDSTLMWSYHCVLHKEICYGFNEEKMRNSGKFGGGGMLNYFKSGFRECCKKKCSWNNFLEHFSPYKTFTCQIN